MKKYIALLLILILAGCQDSKIKTITQYHYEINQSGEPELVCGTFEEYDQDGRLSRKLIYNEYNELRWEYRYEYSSSGQLIREIYREPFLKGINDYDMRLVESLGDNCYRYVIEYYDETVHFCQTEIRKPGYLQVITGNDGNVETETTIQEDGETVSIVRELNGQEYFRYSKELSRDGFVERIVNDSVYVDVRTVQYTRRNDQGDWTDCQERWIYSSPYSTEVENGRTTRMITYF